MAYDSGTKRFGFREITRLKQIGGFNNDWHAAIAGACWLRFYPELSFETFVQKIEHLGSGLKALREHCPDLNPRYEQRITRLAKEAYGGVSACGRLYGFDPEYFPVPGHWQAEKPLVDSEVLRNLNSKIGIVTGRDRAELNLAFELLNWRIPGAYSAFSDNPALDKPNPAKLIKVIEKLEGFHPVYLGDSKDDLDLVKNYRAVTGSPMDFCFIGKENVIEECNLSFGSVNEFLDEWGIQNG